MIKRMRRSGICTLCAIVGVSCVVVSSARAGPADSTFQDTTRVTLRDSARVEKKEPAWWEKALLRLLWLERLSGPGPFIEVGLVAPIVGEIAQDGERHDAFGVIVGGGFALENELTFAPSDSSGPRSVGVAQVGFWEQVALWDSPVMLGLGVGGLAFFSKPAGPVWRAYAGPQLALVWERVRVEAAHYVMKSFSAADFGAVSGIEEGGGTESLWQVSIQVGDWTDWFNRPTPLEQRAPHRSKRHCSDPRFSEALLGGY